MAGFPRKRPADAEPSGGQAWGAKQRRVEEPAVPRNYKTQACKFFPLGQCQKGDACTYSHGEADMGGYSAGAAGYAPAAKGYAPAAKGYAPAAKGYDPAAKGYPPPAKGYYPPPVMMGYAADGAGGYGYAGPAAGYGYANAGYGGHDAGYGGGYGYAPPPGGPPTWRREETPPAQSGEAGRYKTQLCKFFPEGKCQKGYACTYAHGEHELGGAGAGPPATPWASGPSKGSKGKGCGGPGGWCGYPPAGDGWHSSYGKAAKPHGKAAKPQPMQALKGGGFGKGFGSKSGEENAHKFKTVMCKFFEIGECKKGELCTYAHSPEELGGAGAAAPAPRPAQKGGGEAQGNFKTEMCKFFLQGTCTKQESCSYAHGEEELRPAGQGFRSSNGVTKSEDEEAQDLLQEERDPNEVDPGFLDFDEPEP